MRQKALEDKLRLAPLTAATSGQWNPIGPQPIASYGSVFSGRVWGIGVDPRNASVVYAGTDGGGVWKTTDGGTTWTPLTDSQANINIRDLTLAPSAPDTIFAATYGGGILKSTDGGATWSTLHPSSGDYVVSVAVNPSNALIVLASTCDRINRSTDGGNTWTVTLSMNGTCWGLQQVVFDPTGTIAYAGMPAGLAKSSDGGGTWGLISGGGLPAGPFTYVTVAVAPSSPSILYLALKDLNANLIGFYRSVNGGVTWSQIGNPAGSDVTYWGWSLRVHPTNPNLIYAGALVLSMSSDGGNTWAENDRGLHVDHHVQTFGPDGKLFAGNDGGIWSTTTPSTPNTTWSSLNAALNTAMFYPGISISPASVNSAIGGTQDNGILQYQGNPAWNDIACGDGGFTAIDTANPQNLYVACQSIEIRASTDGGNTFTLKVNGINLQDRSEFIPPLVMDPSNTRRLYFGTYRVYQTLDGANNWTPISGDLTNSLGGITTVAVAPSDPNTIYSGASNGAVFVSRNALSGAFATWTAVNLPSSSVSVTQITVDPQSPLTAWAATTGGRIHLTTNGGGAWINVNSGLPNLTVNDILLDPDIANTVYAATDAGVYRSVDKGQSWLPVGTGLPNVIVHSLRLDRPSRTLRAATYGRGVWDLGVPVAGQAAITIASSTAGAYFSLEDGTTHQAPASFFWYTGAQHTVTWLSTPPGSTGTRYLFSGWTDGILQNARTITVPSTATTYTANMSPQYLLTVTASPTAGGTVSLNPSSASGYYNPGTPVQISDTPASGYSFWYLSGDLSGGLPQSIIMSAPHSVTVNFYCTYNYTYFPYELGSAATSGFFQISTGNGCSWSLAPGASWLTLNSPPSGTGSATVGYSVAANPGITRAANVTVTGSNASVTQLPVTQDSAATNVPTAVSLQPASGAGSAQSFTVQFQDPNGASRISSADLFFEATAYSNPACDVYLGIFGNQVNAWLSSDAGSFTIGPAAVPSANTLQNSQCSVDASKSTVTRSGNVLTAVVAVNFKSAFAGAKLVSAFASDSAGVNSNSEMMGTWTVTTSSAPALAISATHSGNFVQGQSGAAYTLTVSNLAGAASSSGTVTVTEMTPAGLTLASMSGSGWTCSANACSRTDSLPPGASYPAITVLVSVATNAPLLVTNQASVSGGGSATAAASDSTIVGSSCVVAVSPASPAAAAAASTLTLTLAGGSCGWTAASNTSWLTPTANSGTGGALNVIVGANVTGTQRTGTLTVAGQTITITQAAGNSALFPSLTSLSPFQGTGLNATLTLVYADPNGWSAIQSAEFVVNPRWEPNTRAGGCYIKYAPGTGLFTLISDDGVSIGGATTPGSSTNISNSQCTLNAAASSATGSGNNLTVVAALTFSPSFGGQRHIWMQATDYNNVSTNWLVYGVWYPTQTSVTATPWYRIYDPNSKSYLYSADQNEYNTLGSEGFVLQGVSGLVMNGAGTVGGISNIAWYRVFVNATSSHFWTSDRNEFLTLINAQQAYVGEGVAAFVMPYINALGQVSPQVTNTIPFYRAAFQGANLHFWTSDPNEYFNTNGEHLPVGYFGEGIASYIFPASGAQFSDAPLTPDLLSVANGASRVRTAVIVPGQVLTVYARNHGGRVLLNGIPAQVIEAWDNKIDVLVPSDLTGAEANLEVAGATSVRLTVVRADPALFGTNSYGRGNALANNQDGTANSPDRPASRGSVVTLYATGFAAEELPMEAHIGGQPAEVLSAHPSASRPGTIEIAVRIPESVDASWYQPAVLHLGELFTQPGITVAVK